MAAVEPPELGMSAFIALADGGPCCGACFHEGIMAFPPSLAQCLLWRKTMPFRYGCRGSCGSGFLAVLSGLIPTINIASLERIGRLRMPDASHLITCRLPTIQGMGPQYPQA